MKSMYVGCVTFSATEGKAESVASGHSKSLLRLCKFLTARSKAQKHHVNGVNFLYVERFADGKSEVILDTCNF